MQRFIKTIILASTTLTFCAVSQASAQGMFADPLASTLPEVNETDINNSSFNFNWQNYANTPPPSGSNNGSASPSTAVPAYMAYNAYTPTQDSQTVGQTNALLTGGVMDVSANNAYMTSQQASLSSDSSWLTEDTGGTSSLFAAPVAPTGQSGLSSNGYNGAGQVLQTPSADISVSSTQGGDIRYNAVNAEASYILNKFNFTSKPQ